MAREPFKTTWNSFRVQGEKIKFVVVFLVFICSIKSLDLIRKGLTVRFKRVLFLNCTDNYDVAEIKVKSVTEHQWYI